jgi:hypothetical protein
MPRTSIRKTFLPDNVDAEVRLFDSASPEDADLVVIPLSFIGDRAMIYRNPPAHECWYTTGSGPGMAGAQLFPFCCEADQSHFEIRLSIH